MRRYSEAQISAELLPASEKDPEGWGGHRQVHGGVGNRWV